MHREFISQRIAEGVLFFGFLRYLIYTLKTITDIYLPFAMLVKIAHSA